MMQDLFFFQLIIYWIQHNFDTNIWIGDVKTKMGSNFI